MYSYAVEEISVKWTFGTKCKVNASPKNLRVVKIVAMSALSHLSCINTNDLITFPRTSDPCLYG